MWKGILRFSIADIQKRNQIIEREMRKFISRSKFSDSLVDTYTKGNFEGILRVINYFIKLFSKWI